MLVPVNRRFLEIIEQGVKNTIWNAYNNIKWDNKQYFFYKIDIDKAKRLFETDKKSKFKTSVNNLKYLMFAGN